MNMSFTRLMRANHIDIAQEYTILGTEDYFQAKMSMMITIKRDIEMFLFKKVEL